METNTEMTTHGNKMIAEFMKLEKCTDHNHKESPCYYVPDLGGYVTEEESYRGFKYRSSWDWLMPVVEKIESLEKKRFAFEIDPFDIEIRDYKDGQQNRIVYSTRQEYSLKEALYDAVIQFIQWYNKHYKVHGS